MWTPKRIVLLALGFICFCSLYASYAYSSLGYIDGLPPLPEAYFPNLDPGPPRNIIRKEPRVDEKLRQAFGVGCQELTWPIKLELHARNMVLASQEFKIMDGRVQLTPLSVAVFGKKKVEGREPEINTIRGKVAYLRFDRPINNIQEITGRKIVAAELVDKINVVNNRRTLARGDDLVLYIAKGPLYYLETKHLIWTHDVVNLTDEQSKPKPTTIRGKGMEMELLTEPKAPPPGTPLAAARAKPSSESVSGVKRIVLKADVEMHLYVDSGSGFMGGSKERTAQGPAVKRAEAKDGVVAMDVNSKQKKAPDRPPEKAHLIITTPGQFQYDFFKDHDLATFDLPRPDPLRPTLTPQDIQVKRHQDELGTHDQLVCQHLVLRLRHKEGGGAPGGADRSPEQGLDIETAHATAPFPGREVFLTSDAEKLWARGNDFFYNAVEHLTILKGKDEMEADKDGSHIYAREMQIRDMQASVRPGGPQKAYQEVTARGPGRIHMIERSTDKKTGKTREKTTLRAFWNDRLLSTKDGPSDLLILTGQARFVDEGHTPPQTLQAETLKVWLSPAAEAKGAPSPGQAAAAPGGRRPQHLEAIGNVMSRSPELTIHDTSRLVVWFKDVPKGTLPPSGTGGKKLVPAGAAANPPAAGAAAPRNTTPSPSAPAPPAAGPGAPAARPSSPGTGPASSARAPASRPAPGMNLAGPALTGGKEAPPRPIDLSARSVEAWVLREEDRNTLQKLWTEGAVHVHQDPAQPEDQGVDIKGNTLQMTWNPAGNFLVVTDEEDLATLLMDKMLIKGPEVNIDQATNKAWVYGSGAMRMESATDFQGKNMQQPVPLTVFWNKDMFFNGVYAEFRGGIQAEQGNARMAAQRLQVFFDRPISLKEGNRGDQAAKVRNLVCDKDVRVEETTYAPDPAAAPAVPGNDRDAGGERRTVARRLVKYQLLLATGLDVTSLEPEDDSPRPAKSNEGNLVRASGPGSLRIWQPGSSDPAAPTGPGPTLTAKPAPGSKPADEEMKLTYVSFQKRMDANSKTNTANFWENVRVLNIPSDTPHREIDLDAIIARELPEGSLYLRCDRLKVLNQPENSRNNQQMEAHGRVWLQGKLYFGRAAAVYFNEAKDQVIFDGEDGTATLTKQAEVGGKVEVLTGRKIIYYRRTGAATVEGGDQLNGIQRPN